MGLASELQEAVESIETAQQTEDAWTDEEVAAFLEAHPMVRTLLFEGFEMDEVMEALDAGMMVLLEKGQGPGKGGGGGNPGNDPFSTAPLHATSSAGKGGGDPKGNARTKTGECECSCSNYVCQCNCVRQKGKNKGQAYKRTVDMKGYYGSGAKARYMDHWRVNHGPNHPR